MGHSIGGVILAAGAGSRFGRPKAMVKVGGETLTERAVATLRAAHIDDVVVVVGAAADEVADMGTEGVSVVVNGRWKSGLASSLGKGLGALPDGISAAVITLVDQPGCNEEVLELLMTAWEKSSLPAATASLGGVTMPPVVLGREVWGEVLDAAVGDTGARTWLRDNPSRVVVVPCDAVANLNDIDSPSELHDWVRGDG